jgi:hypothetical protein
MILNLVQTGVNGWFSNRIPQASEALFHINGRIEQDGGNYYFTDTSGNGRKFLITNYDFPSGWTVGFPYKSKATISAPAGNATLIAADVNNFLYDSGGTPNAISVVSLFQDVDYEHKLFTRHAEQQINADSEEIYEPRVLEIVLYSSVRTGTNLTSCQNYYDVPAEETSTVKWVSKSGNDANAGTKDAPWLTLSKATQSATAGDTIYVKTGDYLENHTGTTGYWMITRSCTVVGLGRVNVTSANTAFASFINALVTITIKNIVLGNATVSGTATIALNASFASTLTFERCWLKNGFYGISASSAPSITVKNSIYSGMTNRFIASGNTNVTVTGCKSTDTVQVDINGATAFRTATYQYNDLFSGSMTNGFAVDLNISYNRLAILGVLGDTDVTVSTSRLRILRNYVSHPSALTEIDVNNDYYDTEISYNVMVAQSTGAEIQAGQHTTLVIRGNRIIGENGLFAKINVSATVAGAKTLTIDGNAIYSDGNNHPIQIGDEASTTGYHTWSGIIKNNRIVGTGLASGAHGVSIFNQSGVAIRYNYIEGYTFGYIVKTQGQDLSNADISYNITKNCGSGISGKGGLNQPIIGNTIINSTAHGLQLVFNDQGTGHNTTGTIFKNNIVYEDGAASSYVAVRLDNGSNIVSDNNCFYSLNNADKFNVNGGGTNITFAQWKALGYDDTFTIITNPKLDTDIPSSSIIIGENLGASYDTGLDVSTDWGSSSAVPTVVTRDQQATGDWEIGAYVQR